MAIENLAQRQQVAVLKRFSLVMRLTDLAHHESRHAQRIEPHRLGTDEFPQTTPLRYRPTCPPT